MKPSFLKILILLLLTAGFSLHGNSQNINLVVTTMDGQERSFQMTAASQLYFENGERLIIEESTGNTVSFQLSNIRKLVCNEPASVSEDAATKLRLLPNPICDQFIIKNLQGNHQASLYTLDGRRVKSFEASDGMTVDIRDLASGMYLLHIDGQTLKMMKL